MAGLRKPTFDRNFTNKFKVKRHSQFCWHQRVSFRAWCSQGFLENMGHTVVPCRPEARPGSPCEVSAVYQVFWISLYYQGYS